MKKIVLAALASVFFAGAAHAADFAAVDTDANGSVSMEEAQAAMPDMAEDAFKAADANGDGMLSTDEFATIAQ